MSFDWEQYLELANTLRQQHNTSIDREAELRCAISRAYYAAHCVSRNYLRDRENEQGIPLNGSAHQYVIDLFGNDKNDPARLKVADRLRQLRNARTQADYYDEYDGRAGTQHINKKSEECIALARSVIGALPF